MKRSRHRAAATLAALAVVTAGCGGDIELSTDASARLEELVRAARESAAKSDVDAAMSDLEALRVRVAELQEAGEISEARARSILTAVEEVDALLEAEREPVEPDEPAGPATDEGEGEGEDEDEHEDDGKGNGERKDKSDDEGKGEGKDKSDDENKSKGKDKGD